MPQENQNFILHQDSQIQKFLKPSELIGMFVSYLSSQEVNRKLIYIQGVYIRNTKHNPGWKSRYDILRDENSSEEITIKISEKQTEGLKDGNLVIVGGVLDRKMNPNGTIQLLLNVSRIDVVQEQTIDENELKRIELRRKKAMQGFRNVDNIIETALYADQRPKIALVFAQTSIADADFNHSVDSARSAIDFDEYRVSFSNSLELIKLLKKLDLMNYTSIALIRGGGAGLEKLDELDVLEQIVILKTSMIAALGHVEEKLYIKQIVDKEVAVPNELGHYFKNIVEEVSEKKTRSRVILTEQIKKQFKEQLEAGQKQNKELQEKLTKLTKNQEEATKKHNEQVEKAQKQNKDLQEQLKKITEQGEKQNKDFQENFRKLNEANTTLQKNLASVSTQNAETVKKLTSANEQVVKLQAQLAENSNNGNSKLIIAIAVIIIVVLIVALIIK